MAFHAGHEHRIVGGLEEDECRMSDATEPRSPGLDQLARDWITIWESELTALVSGALGPGRVHPHAGCPRFGRPRFG